MDYVNDLMKNHPLSTDSEFSIDRYLEKAIGETETEIDDSVIQQFGGSQDKPDGGFPPIFLCTDKDQSEEDINILKKTNEEEKEKTKREFKVNKSAVKIKDILEERKDVKPFFSFN